MSDFLSYFQKGNNCSCLFSMHQTPNPFGNGLYCNRKISAPRKKIFPIKVDPKLKREAKSFLEEMPPLSVSNTLRKPNFSFFDCHENMSPIG